MKIKKKKILQLGPVITIIVLTLLVVSASAICAILEVQGQKTAINNGVLETSLVTVNNALSVDGIRYIVQNAVSNLQMLRPLALLIIALIAFGIGEASGYFKAILTPLKKVHPALVTFGLLFISIIFSFVGEYSFLLLIPTAAIIYKYIGRRPVLGVLTAFIGITIGFGSGLIPSFEAYNLGILTELAARVEVDPEFVYYAFSNIYLLLASALILTIIGTGIIENILAPKVPKTAFEEDELIISKKALRATHIINILFFLFLIYMIVPNLPGSGLLLAKNDEPYIIRLFGPDSPFKQGIIIIFLFINMVCGYAYGFLSRNIKNSSEYSVGMSENFEGLGYVFVLLFFTAQLIGVLNWTNLGQVVAINLVEMMSTLQFSGIPLIIVLFIVVIVMGLLIPGTADKWLISSPIVVPLFMKANIRPEFTQLIFQVADGISKAISPLFIYFIIMIAFLEKYNENEKYKITIFGVIKLILPTVLMLMGVWLMIILSWYLVGIPTGQNIFPTM